MQKVEALCSKLPPLEKSHFRGKTARMLVDISNTAHSLGFRSMHPGEDIAELKEGLRYATERLNGSKDFRYKVSENTPERPLQGLTTLRIDFNERNFIEYSEKDARMGAREFQILHRKLDSAGRILIDEGDTWYITLVGPNDHPFYVDVRHSDNFELTFGVSHIHKIDQKDYRKLYPQLWRDLILIRKSLEAE